jgi:hypothetical protein
LFNLQNVSHTEFLAKIDNLVSILSSQIGNGLNYSLVCKENQTTARLYVRVMTRGPMEEIVTPYYDSERVIANPEQVYGALGRVALGFSVSETKVTIQLMQVYVSKYNPGFPLLTR